MIIDHSKADEPVVAGAIIPSIGKQNVFSQLSRESETFGLVEALGARCAFVKTLNVRDVNPAQLFGSGQLETIAEMLEDEGCELFVVDGALTPIQQRNLEKSLGVKVIDRTGLILEIFGLRARTKAGRLQVETARLAYERTRLVRTWTHLERQRGGSGFISGPGETQIEADRRMLDNALLRLKKQLKEVEKTRRVQRAGREARNVPIIALVGYTNAGKSTLFNALTASDVFAKDMPFATLDPTIRQTRLETGTDVAVVDTVGFITDLPTSLIEAFKATLEESMLADLVLHVHDASSPERNAQSEEVDRILAELEEMMDVDQPPTIHVWNKIDAISDDEKAVLRASETADSDVNVFVSALTGAGMNELTEAILRELRKHDTIYRISLDLTDGKALAWLHEHGSVISDEAFDDKRKVRVKLSRRTSGQFFSLFPAAEILPV